MFISGIVAVSENRVMGRDNQLPWHLPADLRHFKAITMGKPILMGRKTFESIGRVLPGRVNVIITSDVNYQAPGCLVAPTIDTALKSVEYCNEVFVIGGASLFQCMMPLIQRLYLTLIHHSFEGDVLFPELDWSAWNEIERINHQPDMENHYAYSFITLNKKEKID